MTESSAQLFMHNELLGTHVCIKIEIKSLYEIYQSI